MNHGEYGESLLSVYQRWCINPIFLIVLQCTEVPPVCYFRSLEENKEGLHTLLQRLNDTFSKESSDFMATLSSVIDLIGLLVKLPDMDGLDPDPLQDTLDTLAFRRTKTLSPKKVRDMLRWSLYMEDDHPLILLDNLLLVSSICGESDLFLIFSFRSFFHTISFSRRNWPISYV